MKRKILIFSLAYYPKHIGGAEVAIKEITDRLDPERYEFHLICNRYDSTLPKQSQIGHVTVHRIGYARAGTETTDLFQPVFYLVKIVYVPLAAYTAWRLHRRYSFDALWSMMLYMSYPVVLLRLCGLRLPYLLTLQEGDTFERVFDRWYIKIFEPLLLKGIRNACVIQAISTFLAGWATRKGFDGHIAVVPNAVDTARFAQKLSQTERDALRAELGLSPADTALITTSRLVPKNAVDVVVRALSHLPENVRFVVFGTGPEEERIRALIAEHGLEGRVQLRGFIGHEDMPRYLAACDIFVRPSRSEGMGNSFVEAMAVGLPIIATHAGGIADFLYDAHRDPDKPTTGWAVDTDDPEAVAKAVVDIVSNPEQVALVCENARTMALERFDWEVIAKRMDSEVFAQLWKSTSA